MGLTPQTLEMARVQWGQDMSLSAESHSALPTFDIRQWTVWRDQVIISLKKKGWLHWMPTILGDPT